MILLIRFILVSLIIYLIIRAFRQYSQSDDEPSHIPGPENRDLKGKKISKEIGEYIDYEEVDRKK
jgi:hypothetical protein